MKSPHDIIPYDQLKPSFQNPVNENRHKILEDKRVMEKIEEKIEARQEQAMKMKTK
ncbi:FbpB family small basic protein (plasmid) [Priestia megaterium]|uniref:FbpB family small basic protein n=1 Tax=Priestia megaterium TaxID=1404 RepID=UPI00196B6E70|nr:FbpB family small basic protein [Priestia megaterium]